MLILSRAILVYRSFYTSCCAITVGAQSFPAIMVTASSHYRRGPRMLSLFQAGASRLIEVPRLRYLLSLQRSIFH
jgi:hypothetical protein